VTGREIITTSKCEDRKKRHVLCKLAVMILMFVQLTEMQEFYELRGIIPDLYET
jgi:hypothetical protein